jgi:hypothetical protein
MEMILGLLSGGSSGYVWAGLAVVALLAIGKIVRWWNLPAVAEARAKRAEERQKQLTERAKIKSERVKAAREAKEKAKAEREKNKAENPGQERSRRDRRRQNKTGSV